MQSRPSLAAGLFLLPNAQGIARYDAEPLMTEQPVIDTPVTLPPPMTTAEHVRREEAELAGEARPDAPVVEAKAEPEVVAPEVEADSTKPDADLSEAARVLRRNRADERKAKIQADINALKREEYELRDRVTRARQEAESLSRGEQPRIPATAGAVPAGITDPNDPKPDPKAFPAEEYDPAYIAELAGWTARSMFRSLQADAAQRAEQQTAQTTLQAREQQARAKYEDFDAVTDPVIAEFGGNPRGTTILEFARESTVGGEVVYALGKDDAARKEIAAATSPTAVQRVLLRLETALLESAKTPTPKPITSAPAPPSKTVGGGASAASDTRSTSTSDHYRREQAEIAERQKRGYRE